MRELATIQKIKELNAIPNADKIEVATVLGWECVVKKGEFKVGDLVVYIEIDSIVPSNNPYFEFLKDRKYRVRTIKLRGQVSQGLVCPLSILPNGKSQYVREGDNVTDILKITKYDPQAQQEISEQEIKKNIWPRFLFKLLMRYKWFRKLQSKKKSLWPSFLIKTDEERLQKIPGVLTKMLEQKIPIYITEKLDGQSGTYYWNKKKFGVCSRNLELKKRNNSSYWQIADKYCMKEELQKFAKVLGIKNIAIQGEIIGPSIQGNKYKLKDYAFYIYNIFDIDKRKYIPPMYFHGKINVTCLPMVPLLDVIKMSDEKDVHWWVNYSKGCSNLNENIKREGIVVRENNISCKPISFKVINPEFLLEHGE